MRDQSQGFTMLEVMLAIALFAMTIGLVSSIWGSQYSRTLGDIRLMRRQEDLRYAFNRITRLLREARADSVRISSAGSVLEYVDADGVARGFRYDALEKEIEEKNGAGGWLPVAGGVETLDFVYQPSGPVVNVSASSRTGNGPAVELRTGVRLRVLQ